MHARDRGRGTPRVLREDEGLPEAAGAGTHLRRGSSILVGHALRTAKVSEQEVELVLRGLVGKLVQTLLGGGRGLQTTTTTTLHLVI